MLALAALLAACGGDEAEGPEREPRPLDPEAPPVAGVVRIAVEPRAVELLVGEQSQLAVTAQTTLGTTVTGSHYTWRSRHTDLATVSSTGRVMAVAPGRTFIVAEAPGGLRDSAAVVIRPVEVIVSVDPATAELAVGDTIRLAASARTGTGSTMSGVTFAWSSREPDVASVTGQGIVVGRSAGQAVIRAVGAEAADSALITVTEPVTILLSEDFDATGFAARGWYDNTALATTAAQHAPGSARALEVRFQQGATLPVWGSATRHLFPATDRVYVSYWVKYAPGWVGSGQSYQPHEIQLITNRDGLYVGPATTRLTAYIEHNYQQGGIPQLHITDARNIDVTRVLTDLVGVTEARAVAGCNGNGDAYPTDCYAKGGGAWGNEKRWRASEPWFLPVAGPRYQADWHFIEVYFELNTIQNGIGLPNGRARYWYDGTLVLAIDDILFRTGAQSGMRFNQLVIGPYIGAGSPKDQTMWIDDLTVADGRP